jgi:hypothetical protein
MQRLITTTSRLSHRVTLTDWLPHHREAIHESNILEEASHQSKTTVLFHNSKDRVVSADICSLTGTGQKAMLKFLEHLTPRQAEWLVPNECISEYTTKEWAHLRWKYAIRIDNKGGDTTYKDAIFSKRNLKVWGFELYMEKAKAHIFAPAPLENSLSIRGRSGNERTTGNSDIDGSRNSRGYVYIRTCGYIYIYIYTYICMYVYVYRYIYERTTGNSDIDGSRNSRV